MLLDSPQTTLHTEGRQHTPKLKKIQINLRQNMNLNASLHFILYKAGIIYTNFKVLGKSKAITRQKINSAKVKRLHQFSNQPL
jgi:hypothetical protein